MQSVNLDSDTSVGNEFMCPYNQSTLEQNGCDIACVQSVEQELRTLRSWCEQISSEDSVFLYEPKAFAVFFCQELHAAKKAYQRNKHHAWNKKSYVFHSACFILVSGLSAVATQFILEQISETPSKTAMVVVFGVLCVGAITASIQNWRDKRAYDETWARHSARYHRMRLALKQFLLSSKTIAEFNTFALKIFAILERNLDQFELNISSNGLAEVRAPEKEDA